MKNIDIEYLIEGEGSENKINECSWVAVVSKTEEDSKVYFYNNKGTLEEDIGSFAMFFEAVQDVVDFPKGDEKEMRSYEGENSSTFYVTATTIIHDYEEYSGKEIEVPVIKSLVIDCYNGGVTLEDLPKLIEVTEKSVDRLDSDEAIQVKESMKEDKDPYVRHGISRKSF